MKPTPIVINQIPGKQSTSQLLIEKMNCLLNNVRARAYEFFERRGRDNGYDLDDWFRAEEELGVLQPAKVEETKTEIRIRIERPEFSSEQMKVYAEPQAITVEGSAVQTNGSQDSQNRTERTLYGRYELPVEINTGSVTADLKDGALEIIARKTKSAAEKPPKEAVKSTPLTTQRQKDRSVRA